MCSGLENYRLVVEHCSEGKLGAAYYAPSKILIAEGYMLIRCELEESCS